MLESKLVFAHLRKDSTDVQMNVTRVGDLQAIVDSLLTEVQVVVLYFKGFL